MDAPMTRELNPFQRLEQVVDTLDRLERATGEPQDHVQIAKGMPGRAPSWLVFNHLCAAERAGCVVSIWDVKYGFRWRLG